jgi:hypothetical protein
VVRHPWDVPEIEFDYPFMETVRAEGSGVLHVVLRCSRFKESKDA